MKPLKNHLPSTTANLNADYENGTSHLKNGVGDDDLDKSRPLARRLLRELAPLFPVVASATRDQAGAKAWVEAWARQIALAGLNGEDMARALRRLGELNQSRPFDWPAFLSLAQLPRSETRSAWERALKAAGRLGEKPAWHFLDPLTYTTWMQLAAAGIDLRNPSNGDLEIWHRTMCQLSCRKREWQKPKESEGEQLEHKVDNLACLARLKTALPWLDE